MSEHRKYVCEYGYIHSQCRCDAKDKIETRVACYIDSHSTAPLSSAMPENSTPDPNGPENAVQAVYEPVSVDLKQTLDALVPLTGIRQATVKELQTAIYLVNQANGWFEDDRPFSADIALLHSEVSEAYEGFRNNDTANAHEELADVFIRLLDTCERHGVDLVAETISKIHKNAQRGYRHGGKTE